MADDNINYQLESTEVVNQESVEEIKIEDEASNAVEINNESNPFIRFIGNRRSEIRIYSSLRTRDFHKERFNLVRRWFLTLVCLSCGTYALISIGLLSVSIPEIEEQFGLLSKDSGFISAVLDISASICTIIISLLAKSKEVIWISGGMFIMSVGCIIFAIPALLGVSKANDYRPSQLPENSYCSLTHNAKTSFASAASAAYDSTHSEITKIARICFYVGYAIVGCGLSATPLLGPVIIRKFYTTELRSTRLAIFYFCTIAGPAFAYLLGKLFNSIPVNLKGGFTQGKFIGAWWLCFVLGSVISAVLSASLAIAYRVYFDYYPTNQMEDEEALNKTRPFKERINSLRRLFRNVSFIFITLANPLLELLISGVGIFLPKYVEDQFGFEGSDAGLIAGASTIPGAIFGMFIGGFLIKYFKLDFRDICLFGVILSVIAAALTPILLLGCPQPKLIYPGLTTDYISDNFVTGCVENCTCSEKTPNQVCIDSEHLLLSSPCLAGCRGFQEKDQMIEYINCKCVKKSGFKVRQGKCNLKCPFFYLIIAVVFFLNLSLFSLYVPLTELTLRCISCEDTILAMGIQQLAQRLAGQVPGPLVIGLLIDKACVFWSNVGNNKSARYCLFYNLYNYRKNVVLITSPILLLVGICFGGAMYFSPKKPRKSKET